MRRLAAAAALVTTLVVLLVAGTGANGTDGGYRVDAIFDNASFLIPGQDVKIAGARVGEVADVVLTRDHRARIQMRIDERFAPFRSDARCTIQPQSLIGEKFLQCTPGTPRGEELRPSGGRAPTVPLESTSSPIDLDLVFATFRRPTNERLGILVNELGAGLAGRADQLSAAIRRANPALLETRRVLRIADADRARLRRLLRASRTVVAELARRRGRVQDAIDETGTVTRVVAERRDRLRAAVRELAPLLREAEPSLRSLERLAEDGTPVLADLQRAAPDLVRLARAAPPLAEAARPALTRLGTASQAGAEALRAARPVVRDLRRFARAALPAGRLLDELLRSLRATGTVEGLQDFAYYAALTTSRFDEVSHIIPAHLLGTECSEYATVTVPDCSANFAAGGRAAAGSPHGDRRAGRTRPRRDGMGPADGRRSQPRPSARRPARPAPASPARPSLDLPGLPPIELPEVLAPRGDAERDLLDFLLG